MAWPLLPANQKGAGMPVILRLLRPRQPAVRPGRTALVLAERGLGSGRLGKRMRDLRGHPLVRLQDTSTFPPGGHQRRRARPWVPGPGHAGVGRGTACKDRALRRVGTLIVVWEEGHADPWVGLTDRPPERVGLAWSGLRVWVELGFRAVKGWGWQWPKTRRTDPPRVARHWLVRAVALLGVRATGTRAEDAERRGVPPAARRRPPEPTPLPHPTVPHPRLLSVFPAGLSWLRHQLGRGRLWRRLWLFPEPWPALPPDLMILSPKVA